MKKIVLSLLMILMALSACTTKKPLDPTTLYFSAFYVGPLTELPEKDTLTLNDIQRDKLETVLKTEEWEKTTEVASFESGYALMDSQRRTLFFGFQSDQTIIVITDSDDVSVTYKAPLSVYDDALAVLESILTDVRPSASQQAAVFVVANVRTGDTIQSMNDFLLTSEQSTALSAMMDIPHWESTTFKNSDSYTPYIVLYTQDKMVRIYGIQGKIYAIFSDLDVILTNQEAYSTDIDLIQLKAFLTPLYAPILPSQTLIQAKLNRMYIGQGYGEITFLKPDYFQNLNASQSQILSDRIDRSTWIKMARFQPMTEYGAFYVLTDELGNTYYFMEDSETTTVNVINGFTQETYVANSAGLLDLRSQLIDWYVPKGVIPEVKGFILEQAYSGGFYLGDTLIATLTLAQSQKIMEILNPESWKQAYDIPPADWSYKRKLVTNNGDVLFISNSEVHILLKVNEEVNSYSKYDVYTIPNGIFTQLVDYLDTLD